MEDKNKKIDATNNQENDSVIQGYCIERDYGNENFEECVKNMISAKLTN